jgi:RNA polymerase sigma-70 factor (ECF subfamily)
MSNQLFRPDNTPQNRESFDDVVLPHLDAAYRLARWLTRNDHDAEDVVQEASLRAFRHFQTFTGGNGRAWFLRIVRNTWYSWHRQDVRAITDLFDEERHSATQAANDPEAILLQTDTASAIDRAMDVLPDRSRELLVLRELEGLSYRELADAIGIPMGTVMSGLSRARHAFRGALPDHLNPSSDRPATEPRREADAVLA